MNSFWKGSQYTLMIRHKIVLAMKLPQSCEKPAISHFMQWRIGLFCPDVVAHDENDGTLWKTKSVLWLLKLWLPVLPGHQQPRYRPCKICRALILASYQHRKSHCGDKTVVRSSYLHNGISYTGKTTSFYWIRAQILAEEWSVATYSWII